MFGMDPVLSGSLCFLVLAIAMYLKFIREQPWSDEEFLDRKKSSVESDDMMPFLRSSSSVGRLETQQQKRGPGKGRQQLHQKQQVPRQTQQQPSTIRAYAGFQATSSAGLLAALDATAASGATYLPIKKQPMRRRTHSATVNTSASDRSNSEVGVDDAGNISVGLDQLSSTIYEGTHQDEFQQQRQAKDSGQIQHRLIFNQYDEEMGCLLPPRQADTDKKILENVSFKAERDDFYDLESRFPNGHWMSKAETADCEVKPFCAIDQYRNGTLPDSTELGNTLCDAATLKTCIVRLFVRDVAPPAQMQLEVARKARIPLFLHSPMYVKTSASPLIDEINAEFTAESPENNYLVNAKSQVVNAVEAGGVNKPDAGANGGNYSRRRRPKLSKAKNESLHVDFKELQIEEMIGQGAFGTVHRARWRGTAVAVKILVCQYLTAEILEEFEAEVQIMSILRHPNICLLMGACLESPMRCLVIEYLPRGSLWNVLRQENVIDMGKQYGFARDTALGMNYLHAFQPPILHRDLKSPNLLVDSAYALKISDFGLARVRAHFQTMTGNCGTTQWMAPEVLAAEKYTEKADVFSYGVVVWETVTQQCPYEGLTQIQAALGVLNNNLRPKIPEHCPPLFRKLITMCWGSLPEQRPSFEVVLNILSSSTDGTLPQQLDQETSESLTRRGILSSSVTSPPLRRRGSGAMFLPWISKCELVPLSADSYVLKKFSDKCQRGMCSMVVGFLTEENVNPQIVLPSGHHIRWAMEVLGHSFALPIEDSDVIAGSLGIYQRWLGVDDESLASNGTKSIKDHRPSCMQKVEQTFIHDMLGQMTLLFEERSSNGTPSGSFESNMAKHVALCTKVLDTFDVLVKQRGAQLSHSTWDRLIRLILGAADGLLHNLRNQLGNQLCGQLVKVLFEIYIRSLSQCGPRGELWSLLQKFCRRWIHRPLVIEQWNVVSLGLTRSLMKQIHNRSASIEIEIIWAHNRQSSKFELESPMLAYAWYRLFRVIGHPSAIFDPEVYLAAVKGVSRLADEFARIEKVPRVQWEHVLGALSQAPNRDSPVFQGIQNGGTDASEALSLTAPPVTTEQPRAPPDVNTILRLLGPWLFDACLTRKPRFAAGRSEAIRCLGKLMCHYSNGRSKRVNWAYSIRSLMALQSALLDDDERIAASAVYNWSNIFTLYGNHTLRGAGVVAGSFHKAIERIFRAGDRKDSLLSSNLKADGRRGGDSFFVQDDQHIGGIPVVLLRRASIEACSSLLTIHAHLPRNLIKEAEKEIVAPSMTDIQGLYSSLPKYTSSNVVALLMTAIKAETDPTNQQMMMWIMVVAIQQEAAFWTNGLASSRNSQVPFTILLICSIISKSQKYKPPVLFTAFECLRHLSLICEEIFFHHANSVVHLLNACCDFISTSAPVLRSRSAPFYLDSLMAAAYHCIIEWIVAAPLLLSKQQVVAKIIATIVDGNERFQSLSPNTTNMAVREAAQKLVNMLMKQHVSHTSDGSSIGPHSSGLTEKSVLEQCCSVDDLNNIYRHCRFFSVNKNSILTVIEKPANGAQSGEAVLIMRDSTGRYVWRFRPRHRGGPRPKSMSEFDNFSEDAYVQAKLDGDSKVKTKSHTDSDNEDDYISDEDSEVEDPLLSAIRDTHAKNSLTTWRSSVPGGVETKPDFFKVSSGEGNTGMSAIERKAQAFREDSRANQDTVFMSLLLAQSQEDRLASQPKGSARGGKCYEPMPPEKDSALQMWEISRRMMSELGFLSVRNWGSVFAMDSTVATDFLCDLESLDKLPERETFDISIAYVFTGSSRGGYDQIHLATSMDVRAGYVELSKDYRLFLSLIGEHDGRDHAGNSGFDADIINGRMLYYSHYSHEACIYVPTLLTDGEENNSSDSDSDAEDTEGSSARMQFQRANVLIVWNECQQTYRPGSVLWDAVFQLPMPTSGVVLIIDPLGNDLYCVHVSHESSPLFNQRDKITNQEDYVDEADVFTSRVLGPLLDGMVVNGAWLAPLVRQTAINAAILSRSFHRYQHDIGAASFAPMGAEANRSKAISSLVKKHMRPKLPGQFYGDLFSKLTSARSTSSLT
ncbi:uncharacterized protein CCR75_006421 [Bremia lactucae]|uniref:non-specific serine/threonine protein kinase n=1 Tax=Bremia lactucae TaxID=4779 RepID=A0A976IG91_BRELC|nr:hypothetical protein CCR75_006421 [Bremia lactucae]